MNCDPIWLGPAPGLAIYKDDPKEASRRGVILMYHGFGADITVNHRELESFAKQGFLALGLDNAGHGRRRLVDWDARFGPDGDFDTNIQMLINQSIEELPDVIDAMDQKGWYHKDRLGICGISMGGMIAYGGMLNDRRVSAGSVFVSSPRFLPAKFDVKDFAPRPLLSQNGGLDEIVPHTETEALHKSIEPFYEASPERNRFINYPNSGHMMVEADWHEAWRINLEWFCQFLQEGHLQV